MILRLPRFAPLTTRGLPYPSAIWGLAGITIGIAVGLLPSVTAVVGLSILFLGILAAIEPLSAFAILLVLSPLRTLIATEAPFQLPIEIGQMAVIAVVAFWVAGRIIRRRLILDLDWSPVYTPLIIFIGAGGLTVFTAFSKAAWMNEWLKWVLILALCALVMNSAQGRRWEWLILSLVSAGAANALVGYYIFFGGSGALHLLIENRFFRAFGTFGQPNPFGGFMGLLTPLSVMMAVGYIHIAWNTWRTVRTIKISIWLPAFYYGLTSVLLAGGVMISWSRGAWLSLAVTLLVIAILIPRKLWQSAVMLAAAIGLSGAIWLTGHIPASITQRISSTTEEFLAFSDVRGVEITPNNYAVVERLAHWQGAVNMARDNFWIGVGLGNYEIAYEHYRLLNWREPLGHAHNYYLNVFAETGMMGLIAYCGMWLSIIWLTLRARRHPDLLGRYIMTGLLGSWIYLAVHSITDNLYVNNIFLHLGVMLGITGVLYRQTWQHYQVE